MSISAARSFATAIPIPGPIPLDPFEIIINRIGLMAGESHHEKDSQIYGEPLPVCRRDIGDYLGLTLETVSRALSQFHEQGVLDFSGARHIGLRNRALLRSMEI